MKYDLSIIVPIYNVEKYLDQTIQSLLNQKEFDYEILLVNDGSKDACLMVCEKYQKENPEKIQVINKQNGGLPSARKAGVKAARGEYITFLDGDDWIDADYYYNMLVTAREHQAEVVCSSYKLSYPDKETEDKNAVETGVYEADELEKVKTRILYNEPYYTYGIYPSLCMKIIQKCYLEKYIYQVPDDVTLAEDAACTYPILFSCRKLVVLSENTGYHYRQIETSMLHSYDAKKIDRVIRVMDYLEVVFAPYYEKYSGQITMYYTQLIKELVKNELLGNVSFHDKKKKISTLLQKDYIIRTLDDLSDFPLLYRIFFLMIKKQKFAILNIVYTIYKRMKREA